MYNVWIFVIFGIFVCYVHLYLGYAFCLMTLKSKTKWRDEDREKKETKKKE